VSSKAFSAPDLFTDLRIGSNRHRRRSPTSIHILSDDLLLNIFHVYQLAHGLEEYENEGFQFMTELKIPLTNQFHRHWWYNLAHVCRHWQNLILASASWLKVQLVCTSGVPVADMLAHSPPLPLTIYYQPIEWRRILTPEDESDMLLALLHHDRVRHICFSSRRPASVLKNVITAMGDEFPILEQLYINVLPVSNNWFIIPITFQVPNLRCLILYNFWAYLPPNHLLTLLSFVPQLETLRLVTSYLIRDVEPGQIPNMIHVTLTNLRQFIFKGSSGYLKYLITQISAPSLSVFHVYLYY
jgi:hypothetical protein